MIIQYKNINGDIYYLHCGKTKTGKPCYFLSKNDNEDDMPDKIPDGYEIYERVDGRVYLRKIQPQLIFPDELQYVQKQFENVVVYQSQRQVTGIYQVLSECGISIPGKKLSSLTDLLVGKCKAEAHKDEIILYCLKGKQMQPLLKFCLIDESKRQFRVCCYNYDSYKSAKDKWKETTHTGKLEKLVDKFREIVQTEKYDQYF